MSEAQIIDGKAFAARLRERVAAEVAKLKENHELTPSLTVVLVGEDPASQVYVRSKGKLTGEAGMGSDTIRLDADTSEQELLDLIDKLNNDDAVNGILVQLPLPDQIDEAKVISTIDPDKDVDGFHVVNVGRLWTGAEAPVAVHAVRLSANVERDAWRSKRHACPGAGPFQHCRKNPWRRCFWPNTVR